MAYQYENQITEEEKEPIVETVVISGIRSDHLRLLCDNEGKVTQEQRQQNFCYFQARRFQPFTAPTKSFRHERLPL